MKNSGKRSVSRAVKLIVILMIFMFGLPFILRDKNGNPFLTLDKIKMPAFNFSLPDVSIPFFSDRKKEKKPVETEILSSDSIVPDSDQPVVKIYKYRDEKGVLHFSNRKPNVKKYEVMYLPVSKEEKESGLDVVKKTISDLKKKASEAIPDQNNSNGNTPSGFKLPYSDAGKVVQDAKDVRKQVEEAYEEREKMME